MPLDRRMNGSRLSMTRYSQGDRQEAGFVGIPQGLSALPASPAATVSAAGALALASAVCATLVPRSPLAELVVDGLMPWLDFAQPLRMLDVGTGCGCIAIALASHWTALEIDAVDVSETALVRARANARRHGVAERVTFHCSDVFSALDGRRYDLIVSNPPYVPHASMTELPEEYLHEPDTALRAGDDGLDIVRRLLARAYDHLRPGGHLLIEVGEAQPQTEQLLDGIESLWMEFQQGGEGVVLLDRDACRQYRERLQESMR